MTPNYQGIRIVTVDEAEPETIYAVAVIEDPTGREPPRLSVARLDLGAAE